MPIYEFFCDQCQKEYEFIQRVDDPAPQCEIHKLDMKRILSNTFVRRGGGLYSLDTEITSNKEEMK